LCLHPFCREITPTDTRPEHDRCVQSGDVLVEVNGESVEGKGFMAVMDLIVSQDTCSFTFAGGSG
jgi:hypothetical protein